ncbi:MAG: hypothetical protein ACRD23_09095 [Terriglobales bacterium]
MPAVNLTEAQLGLVRLAADSRDWTTSVRELTVPRAWGPGGAAAHNDRAARELQIVQRLNR